LGVVQFCLFDDTTPKGNGTTDFGEPVSSMHWKYVHWSHTNAGNATRGAGASRLPFAKRRRTRSIDGWTTTSPSNGNSPVVRNCAP
jgi:hypothetical protein